MRKTMLWSPLFAALLLGGACKKDKNEEASEDFRKSVEEVREQRDDLREAQKDVTEERKDVIEKDKEVMQQQRELEAAKGQAAQAHANYVATLRDRLAKIDMKLQQLDARTDAKSKDAAIALRARRDQLQTSINAAGTKSESQWEQFKQDTGEVFKDLEEDIDDALDRDDDQGVDRTRQTAPVDRTQQGAPVDRPID
jgi:chromosome segregation ATPase